MSATLQTPIAEQWVMNADNYWADMMSPEPVDCCVCGDEIEEGKKGIDVKSKWNERTINQPAHLGCAIDNDEVDLG